MMTRWAARSLVAVAAVAVVGAAAILLFHGLARGPAVPLYRVERGSFSREVVAEGILEAETTTPLIAPIEAQVALTVAWLAPDCSRVAQGEVVIRFDSTEMEQNLLDGQAEKTTAETRMDKRTVEAGAVSENLGRDEDLADLELEYAREFQSKDAQIFSRAEIIESEIDQDLAEHRKDHAQDTRRLRDDLSNVELELLELERKKAEFKIERAEAGLSSLEVRAPHDGIFVLKRDRGGVTQVGQTVWPSQPLAEIPRLDVMQAKVYVLEADAGGLKQGVPAEVLLEAYPSRSYQATVKSVAALAQRRNRRSPVQYFEVILELEQTDVELMKPGQRVRAVLFVEQLEDVIAVPRQAVIEEPDGDKLVYRRKGRGFESVEVELSATALGRVVIGKGLEEGDVIALADPTRQTEQDEPVGQASGPASPGETP